MVKAPGDQLESNRRNTMLMAWLDKLSDKERKVVSLRYGLGTRDDPWTLEEVGQHMGVTRERIRQIQVLALKKLRRMVDHEDISSEEML